MSTAFFATNAITQTAETKPPTAPLGDCDRAAQLFYKITSHSAKVLKNQQIFSIIVSKESTDIIYVSLTTLTSWKNEDFENKNFVEPHLKIQPNYIESNQYNVSFVG